jgi:hypothetical protein
MGGAKTLTAGSGPDAVTKVWRGQVTAPAATTTNVDLAGVLTDFEGATITFAAIKTILVELVATSGTDSADAQIDGSATNAFLNWTVPLKKNCRTALTTDDATGWPVTAGTGDILALKNNNSSLTATFNMTILGN